MDGGHHARAKHSQPNLAEGTDNFTSESTRHFERCISLIVRKHCEQLATKLSGLSRIRFGYYEFCRRIAPRPRTQTQISELESCTAFSPSPLQAVSRTKSYWCSHFPPKLQFRVRLVRGCRPGCSPAHCGNVTKPCKYMSGYGRDAATLWEGDAISVNPDVPPLSSEPA